MLSANWLSGFECAGCVGEGARGGQGGLPSLLPAA